MKNNFQNLNLKDFFSIEYIFYYEKECQIRKPKSWDGKYIFVNLFENAENCGELQNYRTINSNVKFM